MKVSTSIELVWQLAMREAISADFEKVQPEHFMEGVLKLADLPADQVRQQNGGDSATVRLAKEIEILSKILSDRNIDATQVRRDLRARLGRGDATYAGGMLHRSDASRELFSAAASLASQAGDEALRARHLLAALLALPTEHMKAALSGDSSAAEKQQPTATKLDALGRDLTKAASDGSLKEVDGREAERTALTRALAAPEQKSVFLVSDSDSAVQDVVTSTVSEFSGNGRSSKHPLRDIRVFDLSATSADDPDFEAVVAKWGEIFDEAAALPGAVLVLPAIGSKTESGWLEMLKRELARDGVRVISRVSPKLFERESMRNREWREIAECIHVQESSLGDIPMEL